VLTAQGAPGLTPRQIAAVALATAIASRNAELTGAIERWAAPALGEKELDAARSAAAIMGMNNVYYRALHLISNPEYRTLPARLRMNALANPGVDKADFELMSLAVSAINGCGQCRGARAPAARGGCRANRAERRAHCLGRPRGRRGARIRTLAGALGLAGCRIRLAERPPPGPGRTTSPPRGQGTERRLSYTGGMTVRSPRLSAGVVVVRKADDDWLFLLLRAFNHWDFPKGMVEPGEEPRAAAVREVHEETLIDDLEFAWGDSSTRTGPYSRGKVAEYYIATTRKHEITLPMNPELGRPEHSEYRWSDYAEAARIVSPRVRPVVEWAAQVMNLPIG
jgi:AhpD family alkylhydroperoxidase